MVKTVDYFRKYFEGTNVVGETLDDEALIFRVENMEIMLISGTAIEKLDSMRHEATRYTYAAKSN